MKNEKNFEKIAVLTSGGDAPGMNAAIKAVVMLGTKHNYEVYGVKDGYFGLYYNQIELLKPESLGRIINVSGTFLGTSRFLPFQNDLKVRQVCAKNLTDLGISKLVVIGGDGSYRGAVKLDELGIQCVGIPATIDNDVNSTDYTIGFSTALNNIVDAIEKLRDTSISHRRCSIIEVMGRYKGDLALYGGLAGGVDMLITKENLLDKQNIFDKVKTLYKNNKRHVIIVVTEHIFAVNELAKEVEKYSGFETRAQVLGHMQRGGAPTAEDLILANRMGNYAVELLTKNIHNCGIGIQGNKLNHIKFKSIFDQPYVKNNFFDLFQKINQ
jgi:6-phosphofructokinase 1